MNIAYSCDEMYIPQTGISILSLLENNKEIDHINIYFIEKEVSNISINLLEELVKSYGRKLIVISFNELCIDLKINNLGRHIETVYAKLFFSSILEINKIIYIDSDTIINESLIDFWNTDLSDFLLGGVSTFTIEAKKQLNLNKSDCFINDGVVILNIEEFRKQNIQQKFIDCIADFNGNPPVLSEGVINKVCKGKIKILHPKYNLMSGLISFKPNYFLELENFYSLQDIQDAVKSPVIIHYLSAFYNRPWDINCTHPFKERYIYYKSISFWKDLPFQNKKLSIRLRVIKFLYNNFPNFVLDYFRYFKRKTLN